MAHAGSRSNDSMASSSDPIIRHAHKSDCTTILEMIHELAAYEKAESSVFATEASLLETLSFANVITDDTTASNNPADFTSGYAKTLLILTPTTPRKCAGMALYFPNYSTWRGVPGLYLEDLYIRPEYRGRGYGTLLLRKLAQEAARISSGQGRLEWSVLKWNKPAIDFYIGDTVGAERMEEWVGMRVAGDQLTKLGKDASS